MRIEKIEELVDECKEIVKLEPEEYAYFRYNVPTDIKQSYFIHVYANMGPDKLKLYASPHAYYPDENSFQWTSGIYKNYKTIQELFFKETFPDLDIFVFDEHNQITLLPYLLDNAEPKSAKYDPNSVALKMESENWRYTGKVCYISCKNISDSPINFTISAKCIFLFMIQFFI